MWTVESRMWNVGGECRRNTDRKHLGAFASLREEYLVSRIRQHTTNNGQLTMKPSMTFFIVLIAGMAWAGDATNQPLRLELDLLSGSRVIGIPRIESLPVQTSFAKMDIDLKKIVTVTFDEDHKTASFSLRNGDKLKGVISVEPIKLETLFGKVSIGIEHIRKLDVVLTSAALPGALGRGLVLHYSFAADQGDKVIDESGRGNHGTVHGAKWERLGDGGVYDFKGPPAKGDYIEVPNSASLVSMEKTRQLTLALWIKPRTIPKQFQDLICKGGNQPPGAHGGYELALNCNGDNETIFVSGACACCTWASRGKWVNQHMNEWIHIVFTVDALTDKAVFYVNGKPTGDIKDTAGADCSYKGIKFDLPNNLYIGRPDPKHHPNRTYFDGAIGEVQVYDRALSPEDVGTLFNLNVDKYSVKTDAKQ